MSRCEIAAVWFPDRRMKTEGGGGEAEEFGGGERESVEQTGSAELP